MCRAVKNLLTVSLVGIQAVLSVIAFGLHPHIHVSSHVHFARPSRVSQTVCLSGGSNYERVHADGFCSHQTSHSHRVLNCPSHPGETSELKSSAETTNDVVPPGSLPADEAECPICEFLAIAVARIDCSIPILVTLDHVCTSPEVEPQIPSTLLVQLPFVRGPPGLS